MTTDLHDPSRHRELVEMFADTAAAFVSVVMGLTPEEWAAPGLGEWSVRELVGHTVRAFSTTDRFLEEPRDSVEIADAVEYYRTALGGGPAVHAQVAARGVEAGLALGDDPAEAVVEQVSTTLGRLSSSEGDEIGVTAAGSMRLDQYLETRLVELVVHLSDLVAAIGRPALDLGSAGLRAASTVLATASAPDRDLIIRAMLGRSALPGGFTVWR